MITKKTIIGGLVISAFITLGLAANTFADAIQIGDTETIELSAGDKVTKVSCRPSETSRGGIFCAISHEAGGTRAVYFTDMSHDSAWYENDIKQRLVNQGYMEASAGGVPGDSNDANITDPTSECTSILDPAWCDSEDGAGILGILNLVLTIMTMGIGVLATIGLVISGIQWLTARDKEDQIVKAKSRIFNIVIGLAIWGIMWLVLSWLLPGGINTDIGPT